MICELEVMDADHSTSMVKLKILTFSTGRTNGDSPKTGKTYQIRLFSNKQSCINSWDVIPCVMSDTLGA